MTPTDPKPEATPKKAAAKTGAQTPEERARLSAASTADAHTPEGQAQRARAGAASHTPEARAKRNATLARKKAGNIEDKMNEFIPGIVPGQQEFYHVQDDGTVVRWWIVPNTFGPTSYSLADDHPLSSSPRPGWYDSDGKALSRNPREVVL